MFLGYGKSVFLQSDDLTFDGFLDVGNCFFAGVALAKTSRQTWALGYPTAVFTWENHDLSHMCHLSYAGYTFILAVSHTVEKRQFV